MTAALLAFAGVLLSGAGYSWQAHRAGVRDSALLVRRELSNVDGALEYATNLADDEAAASDLRDSIDRAMLKNAMWQRHWPTLADSLTRDEWQQLTAAYANVGYVLRASAKGDDALAAAARAAHKHVKGGYRVLRDSFA